MVESTPAVRSELVGAIKNQYDSGKYQVRALEVANKLLMTVVDETV